MYLGVCRYGQQDSKISEYENEKVVSKMGSNVQEKCVQGLTQSSLYRAMSKTKSGLVEEKSANKERFLVRMSGFLSGF